MTISTFFPLEFLKEYMSSCSFTKCFLDVFPSLKVFCFIRGFRNAFLLYPPCNIPYSSFTAPELKPPALVSSPIEAPNLLFCTLDLAAAEPIADDFPIASNTVCCAFKAKFSAFILSKIAS